MPRILLLKSPVSSDAELALDVFTGRGGLGGGLPGLSDSEGLSDVMLDFVDEESSTSQSLSTVSIF